MDIGIISVRYARALYKFALEQKEEHTVYKEMETIAKVLSKIIFSGAICILNAKALRDRIGYVQEKKKTFLILHAGIPSASRQKVLSSWLFQKTGQTSCSLSQTPTYLCIWKKKTY